MEGEDGRILRRLGAKSSKLELRTIPGRGLEGKAARNAGGGDRQADPRDLGARIPGSDENLRPGRGRLDPDGVASPGVGPRGDGWPSVGLRRASSAGVSRKINGSSARSSSDRVRTVICRSAGE